MSLPYLDFSSRILDRYLMFRGFSKRFTHFEFGQMCHIEKRAKNERGVVVILHGLGSGYTHFYENIIRFSELGYSVFAPDLPNHGRSSNLKCKVTFDSFYNAFAQWVEKIVPTSFNLMGNSLGGAISLRYSLENPQRVSHLVLTSPVGGFESELEWAEVKKNVTLYSIKDCMKLMDKSFHKKPLYIPLLYHSHLANMSREGIYEYLKYSSYQDFVLDVQLFSKLPPSLLIWGKSERLLLKKSFAWFKQHLPKQVGIEEPQEVGHSPHIEKAEWLVDLSHKFFQK